MPISFPETSGLPARGTADRPRRRIRAALPLRRLRHRARAFRVGRRVRGPLCPPAFAAARRNVSCYDVALLARKDFGPSACGRTRCAPQDARCHGSGLCASAELLEMLVALGVPRARLNEHRLGVDLERFRPAPRDGSQLHVAMVGVSSRRRASPTGSTPSPHSCAPRTALRALDSRRRPAREGPAAADGEPGIEPQVAFLGKCPRGRGGVAGEIGCAARAKRGRRDGDRDSGLLSPRRRAPASAYRSRPATAASLDRDDGVTGYLVAEHDVAASRTALVRRGRPAATTRDGHRRAAEDEPRLRIARIGPAPGTALRRHDPPHTPRETLSAGMEDCPPSSQ